MNSDRIELYDDGIGFVECVDHMGSDLTIVNSARVSFGKHKEVLDDKDARLIKYLVKNRHTSTFEHNVMTFRIKVPLFIRSQHMRHRTWSYNEISRRYTEENIEFYAPTMFRTQSKSNRQASTEELINPILNRNSVHGGQTVSYMIKAHNESCIHLYNALLEGGICREQARGVLPQSIYTEYYGTVNLNNLLKFIDLRTHAGAQWEIQRLASAMLEIANKKWPIAIKSYQECRR